MDASNNAMVFNILIVKERDGGFVAHCLELDIVVTGPTPDEARDDLLDLILAQVGYAFAHDNLAHLYRPAPQEVWRVFYQCLESMEYRAPVFTDVDSGVFAPPWIIAKTCQAPESDCA
ncbi:MAG: hypothetical protein V1816_23830 [Pseudomonadota bacterium]